MKKFDINQIIFATFSINNRTVITKKGRTMVNLISSIACVKEDYEINLNNLVDRLQILECNELNLYYITLFGTLFNLPIRKESKLFYKMKIKNN
jgi:hypothetical protein